MSSTLNTLRIALIDDEESVLQSLVLVLKSQGATVQGFSAPLEAIEHLLTNRDYDVVVCDLRMRGCSGEQVLETLRAREFRVPIIIMSGHAIGDEVARVLAKGATGFISKPFMPVELMRVIRECAVGK